MTTMLRYLAYPVVLLGSIMTNLILSAQGAGFLLATYMPVTLGTLIVICLERTMPYRRDWMPSGVEVVQDSAYLALVHVALPKGLEFAAAVALFQVWSAQAWPSFVWWPKAWPVLPQAILMVLVVDFMRYWLHRLSHEREFLWRFHAVHHSPHRLYTLNVGRFHPVDKSLQFLFDALPFIALGVQEDVLSLYFVWFAVNGFFQHSNVDVRLGPLNYLVSGPELHRWHHSMWKEESNHNYGNHLILWDLVFGSWFLPSDRDVGPLGLMNRRYPDGLVAQMSAPFVAGLDKQAA